MSVGCNHLPDVDGKIMRSTRVVQTVQSTNYSIARTGVA